MKDIRDVILSVCSKTARGYLDRFKVTYLSILDSSLEEQYKNTLMCTKNHKYFMICMVIIPLVFTFARHAYLGLLSICLIFLVECFRRKIIRCVISRHTYNRDLFRIGLKLKYSDTIVSIISDGNQFILVPYITGENMFIVNRINVYYVINMFDDGKLDDLQGTIRKIRFLMESDYVEYK